jgi:hypothetical protein
VTWPRFAAICVAAAAGGFVVGALGVTLVLDHLVKRSVRL